MRIWGFFFCSLSSHLSMWIFLFPPWLLPSHSFFLEKYFNPHPKCWWGHQCNLAQVSATQAWSWHTHWTPMHKGGGEGGLSPCQGCHQGSAKLGTLPSEGLPRARLTLEAVAAKCTMEDDLKFGFSTLISNGVVLFNLGSGPQVWFIIYYLLLKMISLLA